MSEQDIINGALDSIAFQQTNKPYPTEHDKRSAPKCPIHERPFWACSTCMDEWPPEPKHVHQYVIPVEWAQSFNEDHTFFTGYEVTKLRCQGCSEEISR
jgi:hypothetical protein